MYWREDKQRWDLDKKVSGSDTVQLLCELMPGGRASLIGNLIPRGRASEARG
jgi:hypothetical protein